MEQIPRWDLNKIFTDNEFEESVQKYTEGLDEIDSLLHAATTLQTKADSGFDFPLWLSAFYPVANRVGALEETLHAFAYAAYSTDTTNTLYLNRIARLDEIALRSRSQALRFARLLETNESKLEEFFVRFPHFESYRYVMRCAIEHVKHCMSEKEENLAADLQRTGGDAWSRLHEQLISTLKSCDGRSFNEIRNQAYSANAGERKEAFETEKKLLKSVELPIAASLNNLKGATVSLNKRRGWNSAIDRALFSSQMSRGTLDSLIGSIEDSLPLWRKYLQLKGRLLGHQNGCPFYDLFAPLPAPVSESSAEKKWSFQEAREYIVERFNSFSSEMGEFARKAFDAGWIDGEVRTGKVGGAYCMDLPYFKESRILSNFTGTFSDVVTLAHELGHAFHHHCITELDYELIHYPMTLAETASIFAETVVMKDIIARTTGYEKIKLIESHLQDSCQVLVDILCRFYFEQSVFEEREKNELSADDFCRLMLAAQEKAYGNGLSDVHHEYMWAVKTHYYSPDLDYYNFPYAFGLLFGIGLYRRYEKEGSSFAQTYVELLKETGSLSCEAVCRNAGFDITSKDFWTSSMTFFEQEIEQLEQWEKTKAARS